MNTSRHYGIIMVCWTWSRTRKPLSRDSSLLSNFSVIQLWFHHKKDARLLEFVILSVPPLSSYKQFTSKVLHCFVIIDCFLLSATCQSLVEDKVDQYRENMKEWYWVGRMCWWTTLFSPWICLFSSAGQQVPADVLLSPKPAKIMKCEKLQLQIPVCLNCLPICPDQPGMCGSLWWHSEILEQNQNNDPNRPNWSC
jgi:hypothetical protein